MTKFQFTRNVIETNVQKRQSDMFYQDNFRSKTRRTTVHAAAVKLDDEVLLYRMHRHPQGEIPVVELQQHREH